MANLNATTTATVSGILTAHDQPEQGDGASTTERVVIIPKAELNDASITPKVNDWLLDSSSVEWLITAIKYDPLGAMYELSVRKL